MAAVAVVGSPSTTTDVTLNLLVAAYERPLYGQMVTFTLDLVDPQTGETAREKALGTVTRVETVNPLHTPGAVEASLIAHTGALANKSGHDGDVRAVRVGVEAVFRERDGAWVAAGTTLSNSPATGTPVTVVTQSDVAELTAGADLPRFIGTLRGSSVSPPFTARSFAGSRGAYHSVVAGTTGSGKSGTLTYLMAAELAHLDMGQIIIDPQGQLSSGHGLPFSLTGMATAMGRDVTVARVSRSLRLRKDAPMLLELVVRTGMFTELAFGSGSDAQVSAACRVMEDALDDKKALCAATGTDDWTAADPDRLLEYLLEAVREALPSGVIYAGTDGQTRVALAIRRPTVDELVDEEGIDSGAAMERVRKLRPGIIDQKAEGGKRWGKVSAMFAAVHNLWSPFSPVGAQRVWGEGADPASLPDHELRRPAWPLLSAVFDRDQQRPAPWVFLDMSPDVATISQHGRDEENQSLQVAYSILDDDGVKARIIRQLLTDMELVAQSQFHNGTALNVQITLDEAWLWASDPSSVSDKAIAALSDKLAAGARFWRKLGCGLRFVLQAVTGLRDDIWKQCTVRIIGYGMTEAADMKRIENIIGSDHLRVYAGLSGPEASGSYTFMFSGAGLTGLSLGPRPVFIDICTDPIEWLSRNEHWITPTRRTYAHLLPPGDRAGVLTAPPGEPHHVTMQTRHHAATIQRSAAAGQAAAAALAANAAAAPRPAFGFTPAPTGAIPQGTIRVGGLRQDALPNPNDDPPPF